jgi:hypothetical protein
MDLCDHGIGRPLAYERRDVGGIEMLSDNLPHPTTKHRGIRALIDP